ncbi:hypothetical protein MHPYR_160006 [uncultured Mycobacterium sp.]|uniref:Uncharacterized protein n=1 Tax=uncultured Mycobacterium sp. TaxID=171292 RepID=A0A1Y5P741_9MYCO|nr:hypothetical protein MHPYR_160006 [uncultured Mycobacterium sp.]
MRSRQRQSGREHRSAHAHTRPHNHHQTPELGDPHNPLLSDSIGDRRDVPRPVDMRFIPRIRQSPDVARARDRGKSVRNDDRGGSP